MNNFEKTFEKLTHSQDPTLIFNQFLDYSIDINLLSLKDQNLSFDGKEESYFKMFNDWIMITHEKLEDENTVGWYDYLGEFYESVIQSKFKAGNIGQFFTPANVCETMAQITILSNPSNGMINDCCCGSARLLLAAHNHDPESICIGQDLDRVSVQMATLNFYIHGVRGSVLHMNTLSGEFYGGYKVNQYLGYGLPLPHIELLHSYDDAFHFFGEGLKKRSEDKIVEINPTGGTVQTTLI